MFSDEIQRLMDETLGRPHNPAVSTLTFTPAWAREFLFERHSGTEREEHALRADNTAEVAALFVTQLQNLGLPAAREPLIYPGTPRWC